MLEKVHVGNEISISDSLKNVVSEKDCKFLEEFIGYVWNSVILGN